MPHFESQAPETWGWRRGAAASVVPFSYRGHAFPGGVARGTDVLWTTALDRICAEPGFVLPRSTGLDAGMWGYQDRRKASGSGWSFHAYGLALDVCAPWNPFGSSRPAASPHRLPAATQDLVRGLGMLWGASFHDWMHLELHLSPDEVAGRVAELTGSQPPLFPDPRPIGGAAFPLPEGWYFGPRSGPRESVSNLFQPRPEWRDALAAVQRALGVPADGLYGPVTADAVRAYQARVGLVADGLVGVRTWARLFG
jgi:peptidoglycan hydrolase-like protein with peptidoglycan-binding domain